MKVRWSSFGVALVGAVLMSAAAASSAKADGVFNLLYTLNEDGSGTVGGERLPGVRERDPGPGGLSRALTYSLQQSLLTAGDLMITENSGLGDVVRFNPANTGGDTGYPASAVFYSNPSPGGFDSEADSPFPSAFWANTLTLPEIGGRVFYHPAEGQPGFMPSLDVAYVIISDAVVPELATWAMLILGAAMIGLAVRRRSAGAAGAG